MQATIRSLSKEELRQISGESRGDYSSPLDIDLLIEKEYDITLIEVGDLELSLQKEAAISPQLDRIYYDPAIYELRLRFSLAHELAHRILHGVFLREQECATLDAFVGFQRTLPFSTVRMMEWEANYFASCLLMPPDELSTIICEYVESKCPQICKAQATFSRDRYLDHFSEQVAGFTANQFGVSIGAVKKRMEEDDLFDLIP